MNISLAWLKQFISLDEPAEEVGKMLTNVGLEVESIENYETIKGGLEGMVIGQVLTCEKHPDADKLSITTVDIGNGQISPIVCGAPNVAAGQKVVVATVGATLYPTVGEPFTIKKAKIRGAVSEGMICAEDEIGLGKSHDGIMVLDTTLPNGTPAAKYFNLETDKVFSIGLTPNHADAASHYGVARDLKVLLNRDLCLPSLQDFGIDNTNSPIEVMVENTEACPRYSGVVISGIAVKESPNWLKNRLKSIGLSPINNVVDITNYILHELGQPLHAFDLAKIAKNKVIVKTLAQNTPFKTLDKVERKLSQNDLMICDGEEKPMCIGGIFGGIDSGISENTTAVFLESAYFSTTYIRKSSQVHGLVTDASFRFARGTDPNGTVYALKRAALLIKEVCGGEISSEVIDIYPNPIPNRVFSVKYKNIDRLIGKVIDREWIKQTLAGLEIEVLNDNGEEIQVSVPPYRVDVERSADITEEILRIYGFENIELKDKYSSDFLAEFPALDADKIKWNLTQLLAANGLNQIMTNSFTKASHWENLASFKNEQDVEMLNPLSTDLAVMRRSLVFTGLDSVLHNLNRRQKDLKLFEFGKIYSKITKEEGKNMYLEREQLSIFFTGSQVSETWQEKAAKVNFFDLGAIVAKVFNFLNINKINQTEISTDIFDYGLSISFQKKEIARFGLLHKNITKTFDIKQEVFYAEIEWERLMGQINLKRNVSEPPKFPEVRRDLSLVIDKKLTFKEIENLAMQTERSLLQGVNVFDVYEGENIGVDKKSYSVSFSLLDPNQTLTEEVIDKTMTKLIAAFEEKLGAVIRK
ncbi:MAG: phenylalanine--tRNA ligase subunit beta [Cytophagales bacterium]|nr:MAG: phenylalanine--tRNA ligase subunit beta [Cytophagales bacterium]